MSNDSTLGMSPEKLALLFSVTLESGSDEEKGNSIHSISELIQAHLAVTLPFDTNIVDELPIIIGRLGKYSEPREGKSLGEVLTDTKSDLDTIRKIRRYAKRTSSRKNSKAEYSVAISIYFTAIANALIFHNVKITRHSYESLDDSFTKLIDKSWMPTKLRHVLAEARKVCRSKRS